jgi:prolipoprotein diacylglyceryltransferase
MAPEQPQKTNGFAIASLIFGIIGGVLLSVIFGFVALSQIKKRNERGRGMAIAGLSISGAWVALICVGVLAFSLFGANTTSTTGGTVTTAQASTETAVKVETLARR